MPLISSDAIVLHAFDYLESSRILRLVTREAGVRSVLAKGLRKSARRYGGAIDLFSRGTANFYTKPGRDLDTLASFDDARPAVALAADLAKFTGASMLAELMLRFGRDAADEGLYDAMADALERLTRAPAHVVLTVALAAAWRLVDELGFAPSLESCAACHVALATTDPALFSHPAGGVLCQRCARLHTGRLLPPEARRAIIDWRAKGVADPVRLDEASGRAHQRLLREFVREHLADDRPLQAFAVWEHEPWSASAADPAALAPAPTAASEAQG
ncbi:MAG: DNA repair protein RecO [Gemmatimonadaceae bacterium]